MEPPDPGLRERRLEDRLFVYGTLAPGQPNEHVLAPLGGSWRPAGVRGHLSRVGWGAELGYPAIELDDTGPRVEGYLFESEALGAYWPQLDRFEGKDYRRVVANVETTDGVRVDAYIYVRR